MQSYQDNAQVILAVDAGGTFLKSALFQAEGCVVPLAEVPTCSNGSYEEIRNAFQTMYQNAVARVGNNISGIAVSTPGPFDFGNGIFLMDHKFQSVKGKSMKEFFPEMPMTFLHDANAFLGGVVQNGKGRFGGITLGTGLGAAVINDGVFLNNDGDTPRYPLWDKKFRDGIGEDYLSTAALMKACPDAKSVKEIAERTDTDAVWRDFGDALAEILNDWQAELKLEKIYIGGGISKAKDRFMTEALAELPLEFVTVADPNLTGAIRDFYKKIKNTGIVL